MYRQVYPILESGTESGATVATSVTALILLRIRSLHCSDLAVRSWRSGVRRDADETRKRRFAI